MYSFTAFVLIAPLLVLNTNAQNNTSISSLTCSDLEDTVKYNSTSYRVMQALKLSGPRPTEDTDEFSLVNDETRSWELSVRTQSMAIGSARNDPDVAKYRQTMFIDTKDSNMTDIGACHQTIQPESLDLLFPWPKEVGERGLTDKGDCVTMLGEECVNALKRKAADQAAEWPLRTGSCSQMNNTMPPECSSNIRRPDLANRQMNLTYLSGMHEGARTPQVLLNSEVNPDLECNKLNLSRVHSVSIGEIMTYEAAVRFPTIDVITFWPNRTAGLQVYATRWVEDVHVELVCMRPDTDFAEGSRVPRNGSEVLNDENARFPTSGAAILSTGMLGWMSAAIMGLMIMV